MRIAGMRTAKLKASSQFAIPLRLLPLLVAGEKEEMRIAGMRTAKLKANSQSAIRNPQFAFPSRLLAFTLTAALSFGGAFLFLLRLCRTLLLLLLLRLRL